MPRMRLIRRSSQPFFVLGVALLAGVALAPELLAQEAEVAPEVKRTVFDTIKEGGNFMYILGACSLAMVALVIYNFIQLGRSKFVPEDLRSQMHEYMVSCKVRSAIEVASTSPSFLGRMLATALPKSDATEPETLGREHVEDAEAARSAEAAAGSEALPVARVPHRPGKWRRAVRRYYTWAELCAVGVSGGDFYVPKLRRSASAAGSDQGPGFDRAEAERDLASVPLRPWLACDG